MSASRRSMTLVHHGRNPCPGLRTVPNGSLEDSKSAAAPNARMTAATAASRLTIALLLRGSHDLAKQLPLLTPGGLELLSSLKLNVVAETSNERLEGFILADLPEGRFELVQDRLRGAFGCEHGAPHGEDHIEPFFFHRRDVGKVTVSLGVGYRQGTHLPRRHLR